MKEIIEDLQKSSDRISSFMNTMELAASSYRIKMITAPMSEKSAIFAEYSKIYDGAVDHVNLMLDSVDKAEKVFQSTDFPKKRKALSLCNRIKKTAKRLDKLKFN